jgi:uncharacterized membrane protein
MQNKDSVDSGADLLSKDGFLAVQKAQKLLSWSAKSWLSVLVVCQLLFVVYLIFAYANPAIIGEFTLWNGSSASAFVPNDTAGNIAFGMHVLLAIIMIVGGPLQLIPAIRNRFRTFHRINGRIFVMLAILISFAGIFLIWTRGTVGDTFMHSLTTFNGIVTIVSGYFAYTYAKQRKIVIHQIWATRLFIVANGVLYFRILLFGFLIGIGPVGIDFETFTGPTVLAISLCSYVIPVLYYEVYRSAQRSQSVIYIYTVGLSLIAVTLIFLVGTFGVTVANWLPTIQNSLASH